MWKSHPSTFADTPIVENLYEGPFVSDNLQLLSHFAFLQLDCRTANMDSPKGSDPEMGNHKEIGDLEKASTADQPPNYDQVNRVPTVALYEADGKVNLIPMPTDDPNGTLCKPPAVHVCADLLLRSSQFACLANMHGHRRINPLYVHFTCS
jgi:hypothetical protein